MRARGLCLPSRDRCHDRERSGGAGEARDGRKLRRGRRARDAGQAAHVEPMGRRAARRDRLPDHGWRRRSDERVRGGRLGRGDRMSPRLATFLVFGVNGAMIGTWVAHIPWLQDHLGISKATLGLCLLCMAAGALVSMPVTGHFLDLDRLPSASLTRWTTLVFCLMLPLPLLATGPYMLAAILFVFGASTGAMDVSMNAHGVAIQEQLDRPVMSSFHGGWSVGG